MENHVEKLPEYCKIFKTIGYIGHGYAIGTFKMIFKNYQLDYILK